MASKGPPERAGGRSCGCGAEADGALYRRAVHPQWDVTRQPCGSHIGELQFVDSSKPLKYLVPPERIEHSTSPPRGALYHWGRAPVFAKVR